MVVTEGLKLVDVQMGRQVMTGGKGQSPTHNVPQKALGPSCKARYSQTHSPHTVSQIHCI